MKLYLGIFLLVLSGGIPFLGIWIAGLNLPLAIKGSIIGLLTVGAPEVLAIAAVALLGKEAFDLLIEKLKTFGGRLLPQGSVGRTRYTLGLTLFVATFIPSYITAYAPNIISSDAHVRLAVIITADLLFVVSLFLLGGDFWDKLRSLFVYEAKATFPERS